VDTATTGAVTVDPPERPGTRRFSDFLRPFLERSPRLNEGLLYLIALGLAWNFRFVEDDAFISYRYAQNLANGHGLVFNPGERVEGYTNFLWTVIQAIPEKLGWTTPLFGELLGLVVLVATVAVVLRLARAIMRDETRAVFAVLVLLANMTFIGYGTSGLEEMFQCLLVTSIGLLLLPDIDHPRLSLLARRLLSGLLAGIALLTRLDSAVLIAAWFVMSLVAEYRLAAGTSDAATSGPVSEPPTPEGRIGRVVSAALALGIPTLILVVPWLVWKHSYYGSFLPNTFSAKTGTSKIQPFLYGIFYLVGFLFSYAAFLLIGRWRRLRRGLMELPGMRYAAVAIGLWCVYILVVGADFMEYRFMVPILPFLAIAAAYLIDHYSNLRRQIALMVVLAIFSLGHMEVRNLAFPVFVFGDLNHWPANYVGSWHQMGTILHEQFPGGLDEAGQPLLAVVPLGVIPYYSQLPAIDMLGLADKYVAKHGITGPVYYPGHDRMAPLPYLERRDVNLIIGQPDHVAAEKGRTTYRTGELVALYPVVNLNQLPKTAKVIEIPLGSKQVWPIIYLHPNTKVDRRIEAEHWKVYPIVHGCKSGDINFAARLVGQKTCPT
jgi:arabinofuranosyltransferase